MCGKSDTENSYIDQESDFESSCREYIFRRFQRFPKFFSSIPIFTNKWINKKNIKPE